MPRGRPKTVDLKVKFDKKYFLDYYHSHNVETICECGCKYMFFSQRRHLSSKKHRELMEILHLREEINKLNEMRSETHFAFVNGEDVLIENQSVLRLKANEPIEDVTLKIENEI